MVVIDIREVLGGQIKKWRELRGMSQQALAKAAGIDKQSVYRLEKGKVWPEYENIQAICQVLDIPDFVLFIDQKYSKKPTPQEALEVIEQALSPACDIPPAVLKEWADNWRAGQKDKAADQALAKPRKKANE